MSSKEACSVLSGEPFPCASKFLTPESLNAYRAFIHTLPEGMRPLYRTLLWCKFNSLTPDGYRVRIVLISLYNGSRLCDLSELASLEKNLRESIAGMLVNFGYEFSDRDIRKICDKLGLGDWFAAGFKPGSRLLLGDEKAPAEAGAGDTAKLES